MSDERSSRGSWFLRLLQREAPRVALAPPSTRELQQRWARRILRSDGAWMILDTETTGFGKDDDIIEIAAVTPSGHVLFDRLIRPVAPISSQITRITGISRAMVADAPTFAVLYRELLRRHLTTRRILAFNAPFDVRMLTQNIQRHCHEDWQPVESSCLMRAYASYRADRGVCTLEHACAEMRIPRSNAHRALGDCEVSARLLHAIATR